MVNSKCDLIAFSSVFRFVGRRKDAEICGVAIMRAGETMENSLRAIVKDVKVYNLHFH